MANAFDPLGLFDAAQRDAERLRHTLTGNPRNPGADGREPLRGLEREATRALGLASPRRVELLNGSIAKDVGGWLLGLVPVVGTGLSDIFADHLDADMHRRMTPAEASTLRQETRWLPDSIALIRTFQKERGP
ncbi:MAG: hypothetical protein Q8O40_04420 [Chloroflexota bacterium]|nr:hypothetical protein [Chloroflexota bacterium]